MKEKDIEYMKLALKEAAKAKKLNEVPIGCVIVKNGSVIAKAYNHKTLSNIATYHAEILAIDKACQRLKTWHLEECTLYTTVEPCMMCTGAIMQSRLKRVVYGTKNDAFGYISKMDNLKIEVTSGVLRDECQKIVSSFFKEIR